MAVLGIFILYRLWFIVSLIGYMLVAISLLFHKVLVRFSYRSFRGISRRRKDMVCTLVNLGLMFCAALRRFHYGHVTLRASLSLFVLGSRVNGNLLYMSSLWLMMLLLLPFSFTVNVIRIFWLLLMMDLMSFLISLIMIRVY